MLVTFKGLEYTHNGLTTYLPTIYEHDDGCKEEWNGDYNPETGEIALHCRRCKAFHFIQTNPKYPEMLEVKNELREQLHETNL